MTKTGNVRFDKDCDEIVLIGGVPLMEMATQIEIGDCVVCGAILDDESGGAMENYRVEDGVIKGDSYCISCLEARDDVDPNFVSKVKGVDHD